MSVVQVEVVSSERNIYSGGASFVIVPTVQGELGIYPRRESTMSLVCLGTSCLTVSGEAEEVLTAVSGGTLEVQPGRITVLTNIVVRNTEVNQVRTEEAKKVAKAGVSAAKNGRSLTEAHGALAATTTQLKALDYPRSQENK